MTNISEIELLKSENYKLQSYISLVLAEIELLTRVQEIKQNFTNSTDYERLTTPILNRITKIKSKKLLLEDKLNLN